jgi:hypothetical protein
MHQFSTLANMLRPGCGTAIRRAHDQRALLSVVMCGFSKTRWRSNRSRQR